MTDKRYQVFISSTYEDLKEERRAVQDTLISMGDFPVQMESFPATDEEQLEYIKPLIEACDYYILIIGGRYGSLLADGKSYTEKEFLHAAATGVPVIVLVHSNPEELPRNKTEETSEGHEKLKTFTALASDGRIRKSWNTTDGLKLCVREAVDHAKKTKKRTGWVKGDTVASTAALQELEALRKKVKKLETLNHPILLEMAPLKLPELSDTVEIELEHSNIYSRFNSSAKIRGTWHETLIAFHMGAIVSLNAFGGDTSFQIEKENTRRKMGGLLARTVLKGARPANSYDVSETSFALLESYFIEASLLNDDGVKPFSELARKLARRFTIAGTPLKSFEVIEGEISEYKALMPDEEIPF
ncbi:DUF4062 domain-containing protein [Pacificibacter marinus]|uniref:DUF4062 domain-containing protein n=1 Tax=Pacificibacter marinus TaxID=658057 RepID=UPI001C070A3F|nr:DUF4062 domain-containing protein [Pacificibacter marinus]MBU2867074.1 DUF4062 domain-containing protein [Pacificibacter marinus]